MAYENVCHITKFFQNKWRKKTEEGPANPGSPRKKTIKMEVVVVAVAVVVVVGVLRGP